jgi:zinc/manganese transport system ATP-binding protein
VSALTVTGVSVELGGRTILDEVSFEVGAGELSGLIGSNGAGKTTLLRVILGLQEPTAGSVTVPTVGRRRSIGYVPQKFQLDPDMPLRGRDLVALGIDGHRLGVARPSQARRLLVQQMLEAVDAQDFADARVGRLSGGEQQRILIAHALISNPRLLLLDEPLANLDLRSAREVVTLLARIAHEQQIAVLISAHEMNALLPVMDRVVYLADGRAASGTADEVVRSEVLSRLYRHHVDVLHVHGRVVVVAGDSEIDATLAGHGDHHGDIEVA